MKEEEEERHRRRHKKKKKKKKKKKGTEDGIASELRNCESRGGRPGLPVPNSP